MFVYQGLTFKQSMMRINDDENDDDENKSRSNTLDLQEYVHFVTAQFSDKRVFSNTHQSFVS